MEKRILTLITALFSIAAIAQPPPPPTGGPILTINEVDYDIPGNDSAEFIEIYNAGDPINLSSYVLVLINGFNDTPYDTITFPSVMLGNQDYYVICGAGGNVMNCDQMHADTSNIIQNGAPDAMALININGFVLVDAVSYEGDSGAPFIEGTGVAPADADNNTGDELSMSRYPDGNDTNDNSADFSRVCSTPGAANCAAVSVTEESRSSFAIYPNPVNDRFTLTFNGIESGTIAISNLLGETLINKSVANQTKLRLDGSDLPQGFYFVTVDTGNEILTKRFVKR